MDTQNPLEIFKREAPEVAAAFDGLIQSLIKTKGLDQKTKQLVYIAMKAVLGDPLAVKYHVPMAKKLGATRGEIIDTILMTLTVSGLKPVATILPEALRAFDEGE